MCSSLFNIPMFFTHKYDLKHYAVVAYKKPALTLLWNSGRLISISLIVNFI